MFITLDRYENALGLCVAIRNRSDHAILVKEIGVKKPKAVRLNQLASSFRDTTRNLTFAQSTTRSIEPFVLNSTLAEYAQSHHCDMVLEAPDGLPAEIIVEVVYEPESSRQTSKRVQRHVRIPIDWHGKKLS